MARKQKQITMYGTNINVIFKINLAMFYHKNVYNLMLSEFISVQTCIYNGTNSKTPQCFKRNQSYLK